MRFFVQRVKPDWQKNIKMAPIVGAIFMFLIAVDSVNFHPFRNPFPDWFRDSSQSLRKSESHQVPSWLPVSLLPVSFRSSHSQSS